MQVRRIAVGPYQTNCYLLEDYKEGRSWMIDPGNDAPLLIQAVKSASLPLEAILITHSHWDHVTALGDVHQAYPQAHIYVGSADKEFLGSGALERLKETRGDSDGYLSRYESQLARLPEPTDLLFGGESLFDGMIKVIATPGHTKGGVCYLLLDEHMLFSGDTLFCGSIGRTDLYGGDYNTLLSSLKKLSLLPKETIVLPGHGEGSTIAIEKRTNPFFKE